MQETIFQWLFLLSSFLFSCFHFVALYRYETSIKINIRPFFKKNLWSGHLISSSQYMKSLNVPTDD